MFRQGSWWWKEKKIAKKACRQSFMFSKKGGTLIAASQTIHLKGTISKALAAIGVWIRSCVCGHPSIVVIQHTAREEEAGLTNRTPEHITPCNSSSLRSTMGECSME